jgi:hypothetical protein
MELTLITNIPLRLVEPEQIPANSLVFATADDEREDRIVIVFELSEAA